MRVFTRPVSVVLYRLGLGSWCGSRRGSPRGIRPRVLSSTRLPGSARQEGHPIAFLDPPVFVSGGLCRTVRFASQPARVSRDLPLGHAPVANDLLKGTRELPPSPQAMPPRRPTPRHPQVRTSPDLPPSGRTQDKRVGEVGDNFSICFRQGAGIASDIPETAPENMWGWSGFCAARYSICGSLSAPAGGIPVWKAWENRAEPMTT